MIRLAAAVLAVLDGADVDSGTAAEIGYAAALGIPVVGLRTDLRVTGDNAATIVNLQVEFFLAAVCTEVAPALAELRRLTPPGSPARRWYSSLASRRPASRRSPTSWRAGSSGGCT